jgi:hypothetical protein
MATYNATVKKASLDNGEHCSADPEKLATIGRSLGHQIRVKRSSSAWPSRADPG